MIPSLHDLPVSSVGARSIPARYTGACPLSLFYGGGGRPLLCCMPRRPWVHLALLVQMRLLYAGGPDLHDVLPLLLAAARRRAALALGVPCDVSPTASSSTHWGLSLLLNYIFPSFHFIIFLHSSVLSCFAVAMETTGYISSFVLFNQLLYLSDLEALWLVSFHPVSGRHVMTSSRRCTHWRRTHKPTHLADICLIRALRMRYILRCGGFFFHFSFFV